MYTKQNKTKLCVLEAETASSTRDRRVPYNKYMNF